MRSGYPQELDAAGGSILVRIRDVLVVEVLQVPIALAQAERSAPCNLVVDWPTQRELGKRRPPLAKGERRVGGLNETGALGRNVDHAKSGVLAQECSLRTTRDLERIDVGEVVTGSEGIVRIIHAVDDHADARILSLCLSLFADTANG